MTEFAEVNAQDLAGAALDWAVASAMGIKVQIKSFGCQVSAFGGPSYYLAIGDMGSTFRPSVDWRSAGPLLEIAKIGFGPLRDNCWVAHPHRPNEPTSWLRAESALVAICRAIVADKIGMSVSIPKELLS